jgi:nucleoid-associated protein YgaU
MIKLSVIHEGREVSVQAFNLKDAKADLLDKLFPVDQLIIEEDHIYTVKSGDTLTGISSKLYGTPTRFMELFERNRNILKSPGEIYPGQRLVF